MAAASAALLAVPLRPRRRPRTRKWQAGTNYRLLASPQPTNVPAGKVEVAEVFWYGCGHCSRSIQRSRAGRPKKPAYIEFVRVPVIWGPVHRQHAKLYYTMQALHRPELHPKVFDAIHQRGHATRGAAMKSRRAPCSSHFSNRTASPRRNSTPPTIPCRSPRTCCAPRNSRRSSRSPAFRLMIVNGKYSTSVAQAGGDDRSCSRLINDLAASEKSR